MPLFIAALIGGLVSAAGTFVGQVLISLGIGYVTFTGLDTSLDWVKGQIVTGVGGLPAQAVAVLGAARVGTVLAIVLSAITARMLLDGLTGGAIKKMVVK